MIDFHVHVGELKSEYTEEFAQQMMDSCNKSHTNMEVRIENLIKEMEGLGVKKAVLLAFNAKRTLGVHVTNEYVSKLCAKYPKYFVGFASFDAYEKPLCKKSLEQELTNYNLHGYKLAFGYLGISPNDPGWYPLYEDAEERSLPVLVHMGFTPIKQASLRYCHPMLLNDVLIKFPNLNIIIAHMGWPWINDTLSLLKKYKNVYTDLSIVSFYQPIDEMCNIFQMAKEQGVINKLIWGTDYPMCTMEESIDRFKIIKKRLEEQGAHITEEEWDQIFYKNAEKLLQLKKGV
ncbi:hypothetical protein COF80_25735 [Bacillus toyonensis]|uniref:amidohydrolase family protein n=1 Tax=Bacillus toyonensis TaxID=155322 RepID=UPI000BEFD8A5|nr:amidohydrolase family protein [Bacillus toyonensis]PEK50230.1 hypothetical protein CN586_09940 [Bacillus toyonensis]PEM45269.1 hypothetical protein CN636_10315 [Bacillus toyonensis]PHE82987.1 hypothetical protein COF80_25735 [Bacillus toyonensis]HDX9612666.1 amidohydrolase [Bacillus toyonensis]